MLTSPNHSPASGGVAPRIIGPQPPGNTDSNGYTTQTPLHRGDTPRIIATPLSRL